MLIFTNLYYRSSQNDKTEKIARMATVRVELEAELFDVNGYQKSIGIPVASAYISPLVRASDGFSSTY